MPRTDPHTHKRVHTPTPFAFTFKAILQTLLSEATYNKYLSEERETTPSTDLVGLGLVDPGGLTHLVGLGLVQP
jgi:hypothetical protein